MTSDTKTTLPRDLRALATAWGPEPSIAPHMAHAPGYTTGMVVRLANAAADEIERLRAALIRLRDCDWVVTPEPPHAK